MAYKEYEPYDYGEKINKWRKVVDWSNPPKEMMDIKWRTAFYDRNIDRCAEACAGNADLARYYRIKQKYAPALQLYKYILQLIPVQDFFDFILHEPPAPLNIILEAAKKYDPDCYERAVAQFRRPSIPKPNVEAVREALFNRPRQDLESEVRPMQNQQQ